MIIELTNNIKVIRPEGKAVFPYSNSLYIEDDTNLLIDTGAGANAYKQIAANNVEIILLSHYHFDHFHCTSLFPNASVLAGVEEPKNYDNLSDYIRAYSFSNWEKLMGEASLEDDTNYPDDVPLSHDSKIVSLDGEYKDGTVFNLGKTSIRTLHTPGHTRGHYAFLIEKEGLLYTSDLDLSPRGPWYGDETADIDDLIRSIEKIIAIKPAILVTSHRRIFNSREDDIEKLFRDYLGILLHREEKILNYLTQPRSLDEMAEQDFVYYRPGGINNKLFNRNKLIYWNKFMLLKHLNRLKKMGMVEELPDGRFMKL